MARIYPHDRFDSSAHGPRVGAHRAPPKKGHGWVPFWWALGTTLLLIGLGIVILVTLSNRLTFTIPGLPTTSAVPAVAPVPTAEPTVDPALTVTVLNGTPDAELAASVTEILIGAGWEVGSTHKSDADTVEKTYVYYSDASFEGAARGVAASMPGSEIALSDVFSETGASITVVVGNDYLTAQG